MKVHAPGKQASQNGKGGGVKRNSQPKIREQFLSNQNSPKSSNRILDDLRDDSHFDTYVNPLQNFNAIPKVAQGLYKFDNNDIPLNNQPSKGNSYIKNKQFVEDTPASYDSSSASWLKKPVTQKSYRMNKDNNNNIVDRNNKYMNMKHDAVDPENVSRHLNKLNASENSKFNTLPNKYNGNSNSRGTETITKLGNSQNASNNASICDLSTNKYSLHFRPSMYSPDLDDNQIDQVKRAGADFNESLGNKNNFSSKFSQPKSQNELEYSNSEQQNTQQYSSKKLMEFPQKKRELLEQQRMLLQKEREILEREKKLIEQEEEIYRSSNRQPLNSNSFNRNSLSPDKSLNMNTLGKDLALFGSPDVSDIRLINKINGHPPQFENLDLNKSPPTDKYLKNLVESKDFTPKQEEDKIKRHQIANIPKQQYESIPFNRESVPKKVYEDTRQFSPPHKHSSHPTSVICESTDRNLNNDNYNPKGPNQFQPLVKIFQPIQHSNQPKNFPFAVKQGESAQAIKPRCETTLQTDSSFQRINLEMLNDFNPPNQKEHELNSIDLQDSAKKSSKHELGVQVSEASFANQRNTIRTYKSSALLHNFPIPKPTRIDYSPNQLAQILPQPETKNLNSQIGRNNNNNNNNSHGNTNQQLNAKFWENYSLQNNIPSHPKYLQSDKILTENNKFRIPVESKPYNFILPLSPSLSINQLNNLDHNNSNIISNINSSHILPPQQNNPVKENTNYHPIHKFAQNPLIEKKEISGIDPRANQSNPISKNPNSNQFNYCQDVPQEAKIETTAIPKTQLLNKPSHVTPPVDQAIDRPPAGRFFKSKANELTPPPSQKQTHKPQISQIGKSPSVSSLGDITGRSNPRTKVQNDDIIPNQRSNRSPSIFAENKGVKVSAICLQSNEKFCEKCMEFVSAERYMNHLAVCSEQIGVSQMEASKQLEAVNQKILKLAYFVKRKSSMETPLREINENHPPEGLHPKLLSYCKYLHECLCQLAKPSINPTQVSASREDLWLIASRIKAINDNKGFGVFAERGLEVVNMKERLLVSLAL